jgi:DNA-binding SARP family transcriptional activator
MREYTVRTIGAVTINDEPVTMRQGALVAALVLHRGTGATIDLLVDAMWAERPPASARKSLHNQVARLRQSFGQGLIITCGDRYRLDTTTDIDLINAAAAHFDPMTSSAADIRSISSILASWHGEPFAGLVDVPLADAERARLELVQARLVETLALARLGRRPDTTLDDAIIDLTVRTATHPLHERAWELLVVALHEQGRRTEALGTYKRFAAVLSEQLGVEPSHSFQRLRKTVDADELPDPVAFFQQPVVRPAHALLATA